MRISDWSSDVCSSDLLLLTRMVAGDRKGRELVEAHAVLGIDFVKRRRDRGQSQALLYDLDADPEGDGDLVLVETLRPQRLERPELVERMERGARSEEHTSELQSLMRISYAVFCLKKKKKNA